jgi:hypothetical protein
MEYVAVVATCYAHSQHLKRCYGGIPQFFSTPLKIFPKFTIFSSSLVYTSCQKFEMQSFILCDNNFGGF